jgi:hypothetical protein
MNNENNKGEKKSAALMLAHLPSIAPEKGLEVQQMPGLQGGLEKNKKRYPGVEFRHLVLVLLSPNKQRGPKLSLILS